MNRLNNSASLYLKQHAENPVQWQPWDTAALADARSRKLPILLSIGYSACHWCHVMAHESFENNAIAALMNELFVNIKVDREERPDLDKLYQLSHQLLTGRGGGWPLTVFLDPESLTPFFAGTYFPPVPRHGMPGFDEVLRRVRNWYDSKPDEILNLKQSLANAIATSQQPQSGTGASPADIFQAALQQLEARSDPDYGGFQGAPKFPQAPVLAAAPAIATRTESNSPQEFELLTLRSMSKGGLRDQLDGGFFRYCVDHDWTIPHFEKMLYDNAQLLPIFAHAARRYNDPWLASTAAGIVHWMQASLGQANGGFSSSIDADADGEEGGFHTWDTVELQARLDDEAYKAASQAFSFDRAANFEGNSWHLTQHREPDDPQALQRAISAMLQLRAQRIAPATDHKQLTAWNALAAEGLARAGQALQKEDWIDRAAETLEFIHTSLWRDGRLWAVHANGESNFHAYLDDHAYVLQAIMVLLRVRWNSEWLQWANEIAATLLAEFEDRERGGFFFTAESVEAPVQRLRVMQDDAIPCGNGIAAQALLSLGHLTANQACLDAANRLLASASAEMHQYPLSHASLVLALDQQEFPPTQVIIRGPNDGHAKAWKHSVDQHDGVHCYAIPAGEEPLPAVDSMGGDNLATWALVCRGTHCLPPVDSLEALEKELDRRD